MRIITYILIFLGFNLTLKSQTVAIETQAHVLLKNSSLFFIAGCGNPITAMVEKEDCDSIIITTDNGTAEKDTSNKCGFIVTPCKLGNIELSFKKVKQKDTILITKKIYNSKVFPGMKPQMNNSPEVMEITKDKFMSMKTKFCVVGLNSDYDFCLPVDTFSVAVKRNREELLYKENICTIEELKSLCTNVISGDRITLFDIRYKYFTKENLTLNETYTIKIKD